MQSISAALESVDEKKENLRKAFQDIEVLSASSLNGFTLRWKEIEDHFDSIKRSLQARFDKLEPSNQPDSDHYRRMKSFCVKMDGLGLRSYILQNQTEFHGLKSFKDEVGAALASASDAGELVLDAMESFYLATPTSDLDNVGRGEQELNRLRSVCNMLLEQLNTISPHVRPQTKMKAEQLAMEWKTKAKLANNRPLRPSESRDPKEVIAFLQLIATYRLVSLFRDDPDLLDFVVSIAWRKQAVNLIHSLDIKDKIPDLITELTNNGKELDAFKFVYAFELVDKFPPVPLLRNHLKQSIKAAQEIRQKGKGSAKSLRMADDKELSTLRAVIKCIEEHNLDSEYPRGTLVDRVEELVKQQADRKRTATVLPVKEQQQSTKKHARPTATGTLSTNTSFPQSHVQCMDHLPHASPYMSSPAQYGFPGINPGVHNYMTNAAGLYGLVANPVSSTYGMGANPVNFYGVGANPVNFYGVGADPVGYGLGPSGSHMHSNPNMPGGFYNPFHPY